MPCQSCGRLGTPKGFDCKRCAAAASWQESQEKGCKGLALTWLAGGIAAVLAVLRAVHGI